jgi:16S rRNA (cytosine967-C5)-methyltransferase
VDEAAWKLERLQNNAKRQGVAIIHTIVGSVLELHPDQGGKFDRVFIDVPCTGLGTLRRNPDIKWRRHPKDPYRLARVQAELLSHAAGFVKTGGALVYATCTLLREENERVAERFSAAHPHFVLQPPAGFLPGTCGSMADGHYFKSWPHRHGIDGFFAARWQRVA